jgi:hypothetical protein
LQNVQHFHPNRPPALLPWRASFFARGDEFPSTLVSGLPTTAPPLGFYPSHPFTPHISNYIIYIDNINNLGRLRPGHFVIFPFTFIVYVDVFFSEPCKHKYPVGKNIFRRFVTLVNVLGLLLWLLFLSLPTECSSEEGVPEVLDLALVRNIKLSRQRVCSRQGCSLQTNKQNDRRLVHRLQISCAVLVVEQKIVLCCVGEIPWGIRTRTRWNS